MTRSSAACAASAGKRVQQRRRHRPAVEIDARGPGRGGMEGRIDVVRPGLGGADRDAAPLAARRAAPSVMVVLPEPERGAATMRPRAVMARVPS